MRGGGGVNHIRSSLLMVLEDSPTVSTAKVASSVDHRRIARGCPALYLDRSRAELNLIRTTPWLSPWDTNTVGLYHADTRRDRLIGCRAHGSYTAVASSPAAGQGLARTLSMNDPASTIYVSRTPSYKSHVGAAAVVRCISPCCVAAGVDV